MLAEMMQKLISFLLLHSIQALLDSPSIPFPPPTAVAVVAGQRELCKTNPFAEIDLAQNIAKDCLHSASDGSSLCGHDP